jgi:hypothetical protein
MRFTDAARRTFLTAGLAALLLAGCGPASSGTQQANNTPPPNPPPPGGGAPGRTPPRGGVFSPAERLKVENELKQIVLAYHDYWGNNNKGPSRIDELYQFLDGPQSGPSQGLASGKYVVYLNATLASMTQGTSNTILAYYKDTPTAGGPVAMADGTAKALTAQDFQAAPKAGK